MLNLLAYVLAEGEDAAGDAANNAANSGGSWWTWVIFGVLIVLVIGLFIFSGRRRKKQEKEAQDQRNAVRPGNKVKTIGGICGIVVEVDDEENTFVLETGTELTGRSYLKFDKLAIYQTDAVVEKSEAKPAEIAEPVADAAPAEEVPAEVKEEPVAEEAPAEEAPAAEEPKKNSKKQK